MILSKYSFVFSHIEQNLAMDTTNKVTNQSPVAITGPMRASVWLPLLGFILCDELHPSINWDVRVSSAENETFRFQNLHLKWETWDW